MSTNSSISAARNRYCFCVSVTSNHSQWPSDSIDTSGVSSFHRRMSNPGNWRPSPGSPATWRPHDMFARWMPMNTSPSVTIAR